ncbi:UDP-N-acetylmuramate--L-alanine ligase [Candidatus Berkelbacteria bacterium]|nr:UDP-N-acetylmuramate--L-alanine ligase [Candidatus Berkelbacteria bacterium]
MTKKEKPIKDLYFIGIKGVAMTGLAVMAKKLGFNVSGSDVPDKFITDEVLHKNNIAINEGFNAQNLDQKPDVVIISAAYGAQNPEVKAAKTKKIKSLSMSELLGSFIAKYEGVGVAGIHGKTTTTSLITLILKNAGFSPSYMIGTGHVPGLDSSSDIGDGKFFIVESDEYKKSDEDLSPKFLDYPVKHAVITSIELDHPDVFSTAEEVYGAFYKFVLKIPRDGSIVACTDWPLVRRLVSRMVDRKVITYGFAANSSYQITDFKEGEQTEFKIRTKDGVIGPITISLPGRHNALNATAALAMCLKLGVSEQKIIETLSKIRSPERRFEYLGEFNGAKFYDDYAHHPTAIDYLIESAKNRFEGKNIIVVFQPHTYSRTGKFLKEFAKSLSKADQLLLLNIWASAREKSGYVTIKDLIVELKKYRNDFEYRSTIDEAAQFLAGSVSEKDVVLLVGAGDVYKIFQKLNDK